MYQRSTSTDMSGLPGIVHKVHDQQSPFYSIATAHGLLASKFAGGDIQQFSGDVIVDSSKTVSLRECCKLINANNKFTKKSCK